MKKDRNLQIKISTVIITPENHSRIAQIIQETNHLITLTTEVDHQIKEIHEIPHKTDIVDHTVEILNIEIIIHDQTQIDQIIRLIPVPILILGIDTIQMTDHETHRTIDIEIILTIETETIQIIEINDKIMDHEVIQTTDQINKVLIIILIQIDHEKIHKIGIQTITKDKETTLNHLIETTHVIQILKTSIEVTHQNIRDRYVRTIFSFTYLRKSIGITFRVSH